MKHTRIIMMAFLSILLVALAACGGNNGDENNGNSNGDSNNKEDVELTFALWGSDGHVEMYEDLMEDYYEENPHVNVDFQVIPHEDYQQKLSVQAAGDELPDIAWMEERMAPYFMKNGVLSDLSDFKDDEDYDYDDFAESGVEMWNEDDNLYGIPFSTPTMVLYYNESMFEEKDMETPVELAEKDEWTWEKFEEIAADMSETEGDRTYGAKLWIDWANYSTMFSHTWSNGGNVFDDDMTEFTWDAEGGEDTFNMLNRMMFEDKSHIAPGEELEFEGGNIAMFSHYYSYMSEAREIDDFDWGVAPLPEGSAGTVPMLGMAGMVALEGSDHPEEAKEVLKYLTSKEGIKSHSDYFVPPRESVVSSDEFLDVEGNPPRESLELALLDTMEDGHTSPIHEDFGKIEDKILDGFDKLYNQSSDPKDILKEMKEEIDQILQE